MTFPFVARQNPYRAAPPRACRVDVMKHVIVTGLFVAGCTTEGVDTQTVASAVNADPGATTLRSTAVGIHTPDPFGAQSAEPRIRNLARSGQRRDRSAGVNHLRLRNVRDSVRRPEPGVGRARAAHRRAPRHGEHRRLHVHDGLRFRAEAVRAVRWTHRPADCGDLIEAGRSLRVPQGWSGRRQAREFVHREPRYRSVSRGRSRSEGVVERDLEAVGKRLFVELDRKQSRMVVEVMPPRRSVLAMESPRPSRPP